jgi:hypothetical protein
MRNHSEFGSHTVAYPVWYPERDWTDEADSKLLPARLWISKRLGTCPSFVLNLNNASPNLRVDASDHELEASTWVLRMLTESNNIYF